MDNFGHTSGRTNELTNDELTKEQIKQLIESDFADQNGKKRKLRNFIYWTQAPKDSEKLLQSERRVEIVQSYDELLAVNFDEFPS